MAHLTDEIDRVHAADYKLEFTCPDEVTRKKLRVVNRDLTIDEQKELSEQDSRSRN